MIPSNQTPKPPATSKTYTQTVWSTLILVLVSVVGGVALLVTIIGGIPRSHASITPTQETQHQLDVDQIERVKISSMAASFTVEFGDVAKATLDVDQRNSRSKWEMELDGDTLKVDAEWKRCYVWCTTGDGDHLSLTLPRALEGKIDLDLDVSAGSLDAEGSFRSIDAELSAGKMTIDGSAQTLQAVTSAGSAQFNLADVDKIDLEVVAGQIRADFTGEAPTSTRLKASAGGLHVVVPQETYSVSANEAAGTFRNTVDTSAASSHMVDVQVVAGEVTLKPQD